MKSSSGVSWFSGRVINVAYGLHTLRFAEEQIDFVRSYFLYRIADILIFQTAYGKFCIFTVHCVEHLLRTPFLNS